MPASRTVTRIADLDDAAAGLVPVSLGGTGASDAATARANLGVSAGSAYDPNVPYVLRFPTADTSARAHVNHGQFWGRDDTQPVVSTGFFWDAWVKPVGSGGGYLVSAGYGGGHELLWGFGPAATGNVWNGTAAVTFVGTYPVADGEWVHAAVFWDGANIYTFVNGVCDGTTPFAGPRRACGSSNGIGHLFVMGSDHSNLQGDLAALRGWDGARPGWNVPTPTAAFRPERVFNAFDSAQLPCDLLADYTVPRSGPVPDLSPWGYPSKFGSAQRFTHPGQPWAANDVEIYGPGLSSATAQPYLSVRPTWVADPTCPYGQPLGSPLPAETVPAPVTPPVGCKIFDSFGRRNQTWAFQAAPTLGSTEAGSLGPLAWNSGGNWGVLGGSAVQLRHAPALAWVNSDSPDMDVRVTRSLLTADNRATGVAFRVQDVNNYWMASRTGGGATVYVGLITAGSGAIPASYVPADTWTVLRVVTAGTTITVHVDNGAGGWIQLGQLTGQTAFQAATGAGLATIPNTNAYTSSLDRYRRFTVY